MAKFEDQITHVPRAHDPARGQDAVERLGATGVLADLIAGAAGSSPHLSDLIRREANWLTTALETTPETAANEVIHSEVTDPVPELRQKKARLSLLIALADLGGVWPLETVTGTLTRFADHAVDVALRAAVAEQLRRGKVPGQTENDLPDACGLSVIAMGKMGAFELNYSSDIDLICLFDETRFDPDDYADARTAFVRAVRKMCATLSDRTADGYVFRTDLRLRPDASVTPVALSMEAAERYYESLGRTWERAAYIKARACAGDIAAGERFLEALTPFVWRRHLDFAAIQDAHDIRNRIRDHKGLHQPISHLGHDLKLGKGGIREIEFFTQTGQLIAGGRDPSLRASDTVTALGKLSEKGWVRPEVATQLITDYRAHRETEHRVQMVADQQTHDLPDTPEDFAQLADLSGRESEDYATEIEARLTRVSTLTEVFFQPKGIALEETPLPDSVTKWFSFRSMRSPRAQEIFRRVWPQLNEQFETAAFPDEARAHFEEFLKGLPAGVQVFSLFEANPQLLDLVVDVVDTAPGLAQYLARNAGVFDAVIGGQFFSEWPGQTALTDELQTQLAGLDDYEKRLDQTRVWAREWHFRVGVHLLRGLIDAETSGQQYADVAGAAVAGLWPFVTEQFAAKHGPPPGRGAMALAMGSLGAERLNATSDLDLIVIFDGGEEEQSVGHRPLPTRTYYARFTQSLVTALSAPTAEGRLYEVDMRLRPSGKQGPVATSLEAFRRYQSTEAWTWEHLALTRARPLVGDKTLMEDVEAFRTELLAEARDAAPVCSDVADMRRRLNEAKPSQHFFDVRPGAGGLQDIELFAQTATYLSGQNVRRLSEQVQLLDQAFQTDTAVVRDAAELFWTVQAAQRLLFGPNATDKIEASALAFLLKRTGCEELATLEAKLAKAREDVTVLIDDCLAAPLGSN